ncbi:hypothetical protein GCM10011416_21510 [Polaribacter pacificus]|uniref:Uncharacterized protein n=2 Tax=Polaribacter pacificus TaxID=1775173 RepID=A0A917I2L2_9FLAO|nr:hypothetical protein GCM10011416_21510 [Polaribacter pacificus]
MIAYFFFLRGFGFDDQPRLRIVNALFFVIGINNALRSNILLNNEDIYCNNLIFGIKTGLVTIVFALIFLIFYVNYIQPSFIEVLQNTFFFWQNNFSFPLILIVLFIQGILASILISALLMLYWKKQVFKD